MSKKNRTTGLDNQKPYIYLKLQYLLTVIVHRLDGPNNAQQILIHFRRPFDVEILNTKK